MAACRRHRRLDRIAASLLVLILSTGSAPAAPEKRPQVERGKAADPKEKPAEEAPAPQETPPPYEADLLKLAEVLGSLTFLSDLCAAEHDGRAGAIWRKKAEALIDSETMTEPRRQRFAGAFNRGFSGYATVYRACTDNARSSVERLKVDGAALARDLASRFGS